MAVLAAFPGAAVTSVSCPGDCDENGGVEITELVIAVSIALGDPELSDFAGLDVDSNAQVNGQRTSCGSASRSNWMPAESYAEPDRYGSP